MKRAWEELKPNERRVVVIVGMVLLVLVNWWFVWPHFTDLRRDAARMQASQRTLSTYLSTIAHKAEYERKIRELMEGGASSVPPEDQAVDLMRFCDNHAVDNQVQIQNNSGVRTHTNQFFSEQEMTFNVLAREKGLVGFLYSLGSGTSMVRVRNMNLRPDQTHLQLGAAITIVASYQKKVAPKAMTPAAQPASAKVVAAVKAPPTNAAPPAQKIPSPNPTTTKTNPAHPEPRFLKPGATNKTGQ